METRQLSSSLRLLHYFLALAILLSSGCETWQKTSTGKTRLWLSNTEKFQSHFYVQLPIRSNPFLLTSQSKTPRSLQSDLVDVFHPGRPLPPPPAGPTVSRSRFTGTEVRMKPFALLAVSYELTSQDCLMLESIDAHYHLWTPPSLLECCLCPSWVLLIYRKEDLCC